MNANVRPLGSAAAQTTALFSLLLPVVGVASIPFVGLLLDRTHLSTSFFAINLLGILFGVFSYVEECVLWSCCAVHLYLFAASTLAGALQVHPIVCSAVRLHYSVGDLAAPLLLGCERLLR